MPSTTKAPTTTTATFRTDGLLDEQFNRGRQGWHYDALYERTIRSRGATSYVKLRIRIYRDAHNDQSYARAEVHFNHEWKPLDSLYWSQMAVCRYKGGVITMGNELVSSAARTLGAAEKALFYEDVIELLRKATLIYS